MCDFDWDGSGATVLSWVRARKPRQCCACETVVAVGTLYHKYKMLFDGEWSEFYHCARCWEICLALWELTCEAIDLTLGCGETWERPPPSVAELAFSLPGDHAAKAENEYADDTRQRRAFRELRRASA